MLSMEHTVTIDRPVEDVFAYVADTSNEGKWHTDVVDIEPEQLLEMGSEFRMLIDFMGQSEYRCEVTAYEPGERIEIKTIEGPRKPTLTHRFEQADGATAYTREMVMETEGLFKVLGPIMKATGIADKRNAQFAENLKNLLES